MNLCAPFMHSRKLEPSYSISKIKSRLNQLLLIFLHRIQDIIPFWEIKLQILMQYMYSSIVLKAIEQDSPAVPTLLTDYILKGENFKC